MDTSNWIAAVAVAIALAGTLTGYRFSKLSWQAADRAARAAESQVRLQEDLNKAAAQPYVWADVRLNQYDGATLDLVVGNAGPTVALDVQITIDPPLPISLNEPGASLTRRATERLSDGIQALAPGKTLHWPIGRKGTIIDKDVSQPHTFTVRATGPYGPTEPVVYVLDLADTREQAVHPDGSFHELTEAVDRLTKETKARQGE